MCIQGMSGALKRKICFCQNHFCVSKSVFDYFIISFLCLYFFYHLFYHLMPYIQLFIVYLFALASFSPHVLQTI